MKKICYVTTVSDTLDSFVLPIVQKLVKEPDWQITMICSDDPIFAKKLPEKVRYIPVPMKRGINLSGIGAIFKMAKIFRKEKFDIVQYSTPNASLYASVAAKMAKVPVRLYCQWGMAFVGFSGVKRKLFKGIEKFVCCNSTWIEPDSFGNLKFCHAEGLYGPEKSSVVWNGSACGVDLKKFDISQKEAWRRQIREQYQIPEDAVVYGFVGRITKDKGVNELFAAYRRLCEERKDVRLMMVGYYEREETLNEEFHQWAKNESSVLFCGATSVVEQYMSAMDVYVLPSYREGFGSVVIEAEAMGVPVIISDIPGPTDAMARDMTGLVAKKADVDTLHDAMVRLYEDADLRDKFGKAAYTFATEKFDQTQLFTHIVEDRKRLLKMR